MERLDAIVAGVGVLVLAAALGGIVVSGPGAGAQLFQVGFPTLRDALAQESAGFQGDGSTAVPVEVDQANLTEVQFTIQVLGGGPRVAPVQVAVQVQGPDNLTATPAGQTLAAPSPGGGVTFDVTIPVAEAPAPAAVSAASEAEALDGAAPTSTLGSGTWTITVSTSRGVATPNVEQYTVTVDPAVVHYQGVVQPDVANPR